MIGNAICRNNNEIARRQQRLTLYVVHKESVIHQFKNQNQNKNKNKKPQRHNLSKYSPSCSHPLSYIYAVLLLNFLASFRNWLNSSSDIQMLEISLYKTFSWFKSELLNSYLFITTCRSPQVYLSFRRSSFLWSCFLYQQVTRVLHAKCWSGRHFMEFPCTAPSSMPECLCQSHLLPYNWIVYQKKPEKGRQISKVTPGSH